MATTISCAILRRNVSDRSQFETTGLAGRSHRVAGATVGIGEGSGFTGLLCGDARNRRARQRKITAARRALTLVYPASLRFGWTRNREESQAAFVRSSSAANGLRSAASAALRWRFSAERCRRPCSLRSDRACRRSPKSAVTGRFGLMTRTFWINSTPVNFGMRKSVISRSKFSRLELIQRL